MGVSRQVSRIRRARWRSSEIGSSLNRGSGKTPPEMHSVLEKPLVVIQRGIIGQRRPR